MTTALTDSTGAARREERALGPAVPPTAFHIIKAIAGREIRAASRRRLVRFLFLMSVAPLLVFATILMVRVFAEQQMGQSLGWDPVLRFFNIQVFPVGLLALGLGTPLVARDRAEDVLFLYATRPVLPVHYTLGKVLSVAIPAASLLVLPGLALAGLRLGILADVGPVDSLVMVANIVVAGLAMGWASAGIAVGASAAVTRPRWAMFIALGALALPDTVLAMVFSDGYAPLGPISAVGAMLDTMFDTEALWRGVVGAVALFGYGAIGAFVVWARVRREMRP